MISLDQHEFMSTYTGRRFSLFHPQPTDVFIEDIAHALSQLCRFTGHCRRFYSVAQHCVHMSNLVAPEFAFEALLHDAAEAYVNDLSRPLKHNPRMDAYLHIEHAVDLAIRTRFGLPVITHPPFMSPEVKAADNQLVCTEAQQLLTECSWSEGHPTFDLTLPEWTPRQAEVRFLDYYTYLRPRS